VRSAEAEIGPQFVHALFSPPKEVLTTLKAIASTREQRQIRGFGDTYYDLITALRQPQSYGDKPQELERVEDALDDMFLGKIRQREEGGFEYRRGPGRYDMTQTAQGIRKIGTLAHLLRNGEIQEGAILFFDEPSINLNPKRILRLVELLSTLGRAGVQVFAATHSYVVLKQFQLLGREHDERMPLCVLSRKNNEIEVEHVDLRDRIPENPNVSASVDLFERDLAQKLA
jgi:predicted ATPase